MQAVRWLQDGLKGPFGSGTFRLSKGLELLEGRLGGVWFESFEIGIEVSMVPVETNLTNVEGLVWRWR